jgi:hypothetical protein
MTYAETVNGRSTGPGESRARWITCSIELALLVGLYAAYSLARGAIDVQVAEARERGLGILALEQAAHLDIEIGMNQVVQALPAVGLLFSYFYATLHYLVTPAVLAWIFSRRRADYAVARNGLLIATIVGLLTYWLLPTAPPRLLDIGLVDTLAHFSASGWWGEAASAPRGLESLTNQYAALPSLHVGWAVWVAIWINRYPRPRREQLAAWAYPVLMSIVVLATANHYLIDVFAGVLCVLIGTWSAQRLTGRYNFSAASRFIMQCRSPS